MARAGAALAILLLAGGCQSTPPTAAEAKLSSDTGGQIVVSVGGPVCETNAVCFTGLPGGPRKLRFSCDPVIRDAVFEGDTVGLADNAKFVTPADHGDMAVEYIMTGGIVAVYYSENPDWFSKGFAVRRAMDLSDPSVRRYKVGKSPIRLCR